jgi:hypothetical protein
VPATSAVEQPVASSHAPVRHGSPPVQSTGEAVQRPVAASQSSAVQVRPSSHATWPVSPHPQPFVSTAIADGVSGQASSAFATPSLSRSFGSTCDG